MGRLTFDMFSSLSNVKRPMSHVKCICQTTQRPNDRLTNFFFILIMQANVYSIDGTPLTSERFDQIQDLFVRALEQGETGRSAFLQQACAGDEQLRREVEC